jgi:hypothetical protein
MGLPDDIRDKLARGQLPAIRPATVWSGFGSATRCVACDDAIEQRQVRYEFEAPGFGTLAFHAACFELWDAEVRRREGPDR